MWARSTRLSPAICRQAPTRRLGSPMRSTTAASLPPSSERLGRASGSASSADRVRFDAPRGEWSTNGAISAGIPSGNAVLRVSCMAREGTPNKRSLGPRGNEDLRNKRRDKNGDSGGGSAWADPPG